MPSSCLRIVTAIGALGALLSAASAAEPIDFAHEIVPILRQHCGQCHTGDKKKGGYSMNTRAALIAGGESGAAVVPAKAESSELIRRILSRDKTSKCRPKDRACLTSKWRSSSVGSTVASPGKKAWPSAPPTYEPPLLPRRAELPPPVAGRTNPVDRIVDAYFAAPRNLATRACRRCGAQPPLIPRSHRPIAPGRSRPALVTDPNSEKRDQLVHELLSDDVAYAEHWLTFWNDLLRNDYTGTGFITGGRKQITAWLYRSLAENKPYNQLVRELIAPRPPNPKASFKGIRWRGTVSASQSQEVQFSQNISQAFLGINMKCASCHDSFIDRWKLSESYGLAAIYSKEPLSIYRCDKPTGATAQAAWIFPELGQIDAKAPQPERLQQLASLMTHPDNGRFTRTIVNRLWHRLMGRGIVHPVDAMHTEPWSSDLLDWLAVDFADHGYDLKHTLALIATSDIYQAATPPINDEPDNDAYVFRGPPAPPADCRAIHRRRLANHYRRARRSDANVVRARLTPVRRGTPDPAEFAPLKARWIWSTADAAQAPAGQTITFHRQFTLPAAPAKAVAVLTCDNEHRLIVNGQQIAAMTTGKPSSSSPWSRTSKPATTKSSSSAKTPAAAPTPPD